MKIANIKYNCGGREGDFCLFWGKNRQWEVRHASHLRIVLRKNKAKTAYTY